MRILKAGADYFLLVFAVGWILGPIRVLWLAPRFGHLVGMLLEAVIMAAAMLVAAKWVLWRFDVGRAPSTATATGSIALGLLIHSRRDHGGAADTQAAAEGVSGNFSRRERRRRGFGVRSICCDAERRFQVRRSRETSRPMVATLAGVRSPPGLRLT